MYSKKDLKLYGLQVIKESSIPNEDKLILANDLKEADLTQTMAFLNKGQMINSETNINEDLKFRIQVQNEFENNLQLQESLSKFLDEIVFSAGAVAALYAGTLVGSVIEGANSYNIGKGMGTARGAAATVGLGLVIAGIYKLSKRFLTKAGKKCGKLKGIEKEKCLVKIKIEAEEMKLKKLNQLKSKCSKSNKPTECKQKVEEKIRKVQAKIKDLQDNLNK